MKLLLDTQALIWVVGDPDQLSLRARHVLSDADNLVLVSAASAWEIATKVRTGKLPGAAALATDFETIIDGRGLTPLPITSRHARLSGALPGEHKDPFDRILSAQAILETASLVSNDSAVDQFGVQRLW